MCHKSAQYNLLKKNNSHEGNPKQYAHTDLWRIFSAQRNLHVNLFLIPLSFNRSRVKVDLESRLIFIYHLMCHMWSAVSNLLAIGYCSAQLVMLDSFSLSGGTQISLGYS